MNIVLEAIVELLANPNLDGYVLERDIGEMYKNQKSQYENIAQTWVDKYAR